MIAMGLRFSRSIFRASASRAATYLSFSSTCARMSRMAAPSTPRAWSAGEAVRPSLNTRTRGSEPSERPLGSDSEGSASVRACRPLEFSSAMSSSVSAVPRPVIACSCGSVNTSLSCACSCAAICVATVCICDASTYLPGGSVLLGLGAATKLQR